MVVGVLRVEFLVPDARSLKEKRHVVRSLLDVLRGRYNVSICEIEHLDSCRQCTLGVARVGNEARVIHSEFDRIVEQLRGRRGVSLIEYTREFF